jgi:hypothetical protein
LFIFLYFEISDSLKKEALPFSCTTLDIAKSFAVCCCLERGPLSLVSKIEELLERKRSGSGLEKRKYGRKDPPRWPSGNLYPQKLALNSPTSDGRSVGKVRSRTKVTEFSLFLILFTN